MQNDWLKFANLVSVCGFDITISFEKYSLELFVKVRVRLKGEGDPCILEDEK